MSALSRFEQFVERVVEGSFARLMRSQLQPVEVAKRLARAMETGLVIATGGTLAPNEYRVSLNVDDFRLYEASQSSWEQELAEYLVGVAREQGWVLFGHPVVTLQAGENVPRGEVPVSARLVDRLAGTPVSGGQGFGHTQRFDAAAVRQAAAAIPQAARLVVAGGTLAGTKFAVDKPVVTIGRALDTDVVIEEPSVSRYHAEIRLRGEHFYVRDLKSTNGTEVNGELVAEQLLRDGDRISLAGVELVFRIGQ